MEYILWGTPKDAQSWEEQVLTETKDKNHLQKAKAWAESNGFKNLRVLETFAGDKPDFIKTIK
jgi:hypothetical protein